MSPALAGKFLTTGPPGKPLDVSLNWIFASIYSPRLESYSMLVTHFCCVLNSFYILFPSCINMHAFWRHVFQFTRPLLCWYFITAIYSIVSFNLAFNCSQIYIWQFWFWFSPGILQIFLCFLDILTLIILNILPKNSSIWIIYWYISIYLYFSSSLVCLSVFWQVSYFWLDMWVKIKVFPFKNVIFSEKGR